MPFLNAFDRYIITKDFLYIDNKKLPLYEDGTFVSGNTAQVTTIQIADKDQDRYIENHESIPDGMYRIKNREVLVPLCNYGKTPLKIPKHLGHEEIKIPRH